MRPCVGLLVAGVVLTPVMGSAQDTLRHCDPRIVGQPRPKGVELTYERMVDYGIQGNRTDVEPGDYTSEVRRNARWKAKVRLPLLNTPEWKVNMGLGWSRETYSLESTPDGNDQVLNLLEGKELRSLSAGLYVIKSFIGKRYLVLRTNSSLNDDGGEIFSKGNIMKHEVALAYGIKQSASTTMGIGVAFSYVLGRASILPIIAYDHSFDHQWGLEMLLPAHARVRYAFGDGNMLLVGTKLDGANYNIHLEGQGLNGIYFLERSDVRGFLRYEREIHDWLWFGADAGYNMNLDLSLVTDQAGRSGETILNNTVQSAFYFGAGLFIVPPSSMWK